MGGGELAYSNDLILPEKKTNKTNNQAKKIGYISEILCINILIWISILKEKGKYYRCLHSVLYYT